jgi:hypothetical protein
VREEHLTAFAEEDVLQLRGARRRRVELAKVDDPLDAHRDPLGDDSVPGLLQMAAEDSRAERAEERRAAGRVQVREDEVVRVERVNLHGRVPTAVFGVDGPGVGPRFREGRFEDDLVAVRGDEVGGGEHRQV